MRFIETVFDLWPDNNTGTTESAIFLALCGAIVAICYISYRSRQIKH